MSTDRQQRLARMFGEAIRLEGGAREAYLRDACGDDERLLADVQSLIQHDENAGDFLAAPVSPSPDGDATVPAVEARTPSPLDVGKPPSNDAQTHHHIQIEGYQITRELSRGGQGVVYQAIQKATKRKVAIKVMREGPFAGKGERVRFEREVEILGQLRHPNVVAVHDSGTASGCFYYVMDYISGQPLDVWMSQKERPINDTLKLFAKICDAINAAHLKGVIHRDLKPGNIRIDDNGEPHILDFGLAKVAQGAEEMSLMTMTGQFMGSLPWASPEQAEARPGLIDIRTDVYSLGVILYQMLTGKFPYEVVGNMRDVLDRILKTEPAKPSTIRRQINDEVETIVLKCLSKERERRYQTAGELARDIGHYLTGEPIEAKRDSGWYVLRTIIRRYRGPLAAVAAVTSSLAVGLAATTWQWRRADAEAVKATSLAFREADARMTAEANTAVAETALRELEYTTYVSNIEMSQAWIEQERYDRVHQLLDKCPPHLRGWEWRWLSARSDRSWLQIHGHPGPLIAASYSPDCTHITTVSKTADTQVWNTLTWQSSAGPTYPYDLRSALPYADSGSILMISTTNVARLVNLNNTTLWKELCEPNAQIEKASLHPDGSRLLTIMHNGSIIVFDVHTSDAMWSLRSSPPDATEWEARFLDASYSPDGSRIVACAENGQVYFIDAIAGSILMTLPARTRAIDVFSSSFSPNGQYVCVAHRNGLIRICDPLSGLSLFELSPDHKRSGARDPYRRLTPSWSPDSRFLVSSGDSSATAIVWNIDSHTTASELVGHRDAISCVTFSEDAARVCTGSSDTTARMWDVATGEQLAAPKGHPDSVVSVQLSNDNEHLLTLARDGVARIWAVAPPEDPIVILTSAYLSMNVSPDGKLMTGCRGPQMDIWSIDLQSKIAEVYSNGIGYATCDSVGKYIAYFESTMGHMLDVVVVAASSGVELKRWHLKQGARPEFAISALSRDGALMLTACGGAPQTIWNVESGARVAELDVPPISAAAFAPDANTIVTGSRRGVLTMWNAQTGEAMWTVHGHEINCIDYDADSEHFVTASQDHTARIWSARSGSCESVLIGHESPVTSAYYSPDGSRVATGALDRTVRVWDTVSGRCLYTQKCPIEVRVVKWAADGERMIIVLRDGTIIVQDARRVGDQLLENAQRDRRMKRIAETKMHEYIETMLRSGKNIGTMFHEMEIDTSLSFIERYVGKQSLRERSETKRQGNTGPVLLPTTQQGRGGLRTAP